MLCCSISRVSPLVLLLQAALYGMLGLFKSPVSLLVSTVALTALCGQSRLLLSPFCCVTLLSVARSNYVFSFT